MQFTRRRVLAGAMALAIGSVVASADSKVVPATSPVAPKPADQLVLPPPVCDSCTLPPVVVQAQAVLPVPTLPETPLLPPVPHRVEAPALPQVNTPVTKPVELPPPAPAKLTPARPASRTDVTASMTNVKVMLLLGDSQPKFDVYNGNDVVLKVMCDKVDVRTPGEAGATMTPLKGAGHVSFAVPNCTGTCDEVMVLPNTGEIILTGNVKLLSKTGKVESEFHGTTVRFKLGTTPAAVSLIGPGSLNTITPTSMRE